MPRSFLHNTLRTYVERYKAKHQTERDIQHFPVARNGTKHLLRTIAARQT